jgi:hypothetical protein
VWAKTEGQVDGGVIASTIGERKKGESNVSELTQKNNPALTLFERFFNLMETENVSDELIEKMKAEMKSAGFDISDIEKQLAAEPAANEEDERFADCLQIEVKQIQPHVFEVYTAGTDKTDLLGKIAPGPATHKLQIPSSELLAFYPSLPNPGHDDFIYLEMMDEIIAAMHEIEDDGE